MNRIMIIEDDPVIAEQMAKYLIKWDYEVYNVEDFENIIDFFLDIEPQLVLIDIKLPFYNGYHWCTEIRKISDVPIIFISSAAEDMNIIMGMQLGADDYIVKPFSLEVLLAKVQAVLRRAYKNIEQISILKMGEIILHLDEMELEYGGDRIALSKNEFKILESLMNKEGKIITRETLMQKLWQSDIYIDDNTLTVNIARLRKRLEEIGLSNIVKTKKGVGYYVSNE
ncbi:MAG: response regulator transcription factor [Tissierellia bacterium]|nr:response regulator transcription factor [Tissierellia bacterium]